MGAVYEAYKIVKEVRVRNAQLVVEGRLKLLDNRLERFYIPLRERLGFTKLLYETTTGWQKDGVYNNDAVKIQSNEPRALRNIAVRKLLLPVNEDLKDIILNNVHWKHRDDQTDYHFVLLHFTVWRVFEEAVVSGEIDFYEASEILSFPEEEAEKQRKMCARLLEEREMIHGKFEVP
jgi:hypothetical protein